MGTYDLKRYLEDLENRLDAAVEEELDAVWRDFLAGKGTERVFCPKRSRKAPSALTWPAIPINTALDDYEAMLLRELKAVSNTLASGNGALLNIRANYGTGILPSVFGCEMFYMEDKLDTLPTAIKLPGGTEAMQRLVETGVPPMQDGWWKRVFECGRYFTEQLAPYPKLREYVRIYHPDLQGPLDVCELVWGSDMLLAFYDEPELLKAVLKLITETYIRFQHLWAAEHPLSGEHVTAHWGLGIAGNLMLRSDSAMNISGDMYEEFVMPFDQRLLDEFGGGVVHFCGKGDQYVEHLSHLRGITGIQMSQPEYNNMETIFRHSVDKGLVMLGLARKGIPAERELHGRVHSWG